VSTDVDGDDRLTFNRKILAGIRGILRHRARSKYTNTVVVDCDGRKQRSPDHSGCLVMRAADTASRVHPPSCDHVLASILASEFPLIQNQIFKVDLFSASLLQLS
jgi:hypothetical protein